MYKLSLVRPVLIFSLLFLISSNSNAQELSSGGQVLITTTVTNFQTTAFNCGCPKDGDQSAFAMDVMKASANWNDNQVDEFSSLLDEFEKVNGIRITSKSKTHDFRLKYDVIKTESKGPMSGPGKALCDFLRNNK